MKAGFVSELLNDVNDSDLEKDTQMNFENMKNSSILQNGSLRNSGGKIRGSNRFKFSN